MRTENVLSKTDTVSDNPNKLKYYRVSQKNGPPTVGAFTTICKLPIVIKTTRAQFPVHEVKNEW